MLVGDRDGHGRFGMLDSDDEGRLVCHECGRRCIFLGRHIRDHGMTAREYREAHGLAGFHKLAAPVVRQRMSEAWEANRAVHEAALERTRDPRRAHLASPPVTGRPWSPAAAERRAERMRARRGRTLTEDERRRLAATGYDLQAWADLARELYADPGVSLWSLAEAAGVTSASVSQRMRRYPER